MFVFKQGISAGQPRFGGLSGLDYDAVRNRWLAVSDDKGEFGPARVYELELDTTAPPLRASVTAMLRLQTPSGIKPDLEALRLDPADGTLWITTEGDAATLQQPALYHFNRAGVLLGTIAAPGNLRFAAAGKTGARVNQTLEGLAAFGDLRWLAMEGSLVEDSAVPTAETGASVRFSEIARTGELRRQIVYRVEPIPADIAAGELAGNAVSEILAFDEDRLLVLERAGARFDGNAWRFHIRLFAANCAAADDIAGREITPNIKPATKTLLWDSASVATHVDNLEGMAFGRTRPDGTRALVLVSDDNFAATQETQFWVFAFNYSSRHENSP